jgi:hypothetical protein
LGLAFELLRSENNPADLEQVQAGLFERIGFH